MSKTILVAVHPGFAVGRIYACDFYGDYRTYLSTLEKAVRSQYSIIFKRKELPFCKPENADVVPDAFCLGNHTKYLVPKLHKRGATRVCLGGEFLWFYEDRLLKNRISEFYDNALWEAQRRMQLGLDSDFPPKKLTPIAKPVKYTWAMDSLSVMKEMKSDPFKFQDRVYMPLPGRKVIKEGCVQTVRDELEKEFDVEIKRELCYPTVEPT